MDEKGQTLIETIVAIFVLTAGISAGVALAIFAYGENRDITNKLTATGLAREGIEAVRYMRDSNWIAESRGGGLQNCSFADGSSGSCYRQWLNSTFDIRGKTGSGTDYRVKFVPNSAANKWEIENTPGTPTPNYFRLYELSGSGFTSAGETQTDFFRKITLINQNTDSFVQESRVLVRSTVWWHGKRCNNSLTNLTNPNQTKCKVIVEEYITNWRDY